MTRRRAASPRQGGRTAKGARFIWRKLSVAKWEDAWQERLAWLGQRVVLIQLAGSHALRIEAHGLARREAELLVRQFGGTIRVARAMTARDFEPAIRAPLRVRGRLLVVSSDRERAAASAKFPDIPLLLIPAGMAFGTGEHATTATCLRLLADVADRLTGTDWDALDVGTGSGIVALAARRFGARKVEATDNDPTALRVARANASANAIRGVVFRRADVLEWRPRRNWAVVIANLFSTILVGAAPQIAASVAKGGSLIVSGILNPQAGEVIAALKRENCRVERVVRKGKWTSLLARR